MPSSVSIEDEFERNDFVAIAMAESFANIHFSFPETRVLVTGGTSGIGESVAKAYSTAAAQVVFTGRDAVRGARVLQEVNSLSGNHGKHDFIAGDITDSDFCDDLVNQASDTLGGLDIVVNCAGVIHHAEAGDTTDEQWHHTMNVNLHGTFYVCRAALKLMKRLKEGVIVNIASDAGLSASSHLAAYSASKGAVVQLSRAMAKDYGKHGIRVIPLCPGDVDTPMLRGEFDQLGVCAEEGLDDSAQSVPLNRVCTPQEVAQLVLYASSDAAAFMSGYPLVLDAANRA